ncbi:hypothetical protein L210DRAFT_3766295 [Boletus edulis BED1]|uniref:C2H2-type domain-containing protein n=1 Tax=Boletus edulis BED1 TaxID=1328754 RepID=A0AAD4BDM9_BOLED|nr:hypothetical protein L210DRAFT_3766295 [Boletus edulis BED1]
MSTRARSSTAYPPQDAEAQEFIGFRREPSVAQRYLWSTSVEVPRNCVHSSSLPILPTTTRFRCGQHSIPEHTPFPSHANQVYPALSASAHANQQTQHHPTLWRSIDIQVFPNLNVSPAPIVVNDRMSTSHPACVLGPYGTYQDTQTAFNPFLTPRRNSPDRHMLSHLIEQDICNSGNYLLDQSSAYGPLSHATSSRYPGASSGQNQNVADSFSPCHPPLQSFSSFLPYPSSRSVSTGYPEPDPCFPLVSPPDSSASSRRRRGACAIEYAGLWIDEEELFQGLTEPSGKLNLHQCLWEADRSPCHLWVKSDKSCINTHIQKWHKVRAGGDKLEVECHWSACGRTMLKESIARHILSIHLGEMWMCQACGKKIARKDVYRRHIVRSNFEGCRTAGAQITYSADVRVIDVRAALDSGGRLRYADE